MAHRVTGLNGGIAGVLASQAVNIRRSRPPSTAKRGEVRLILGHEHAETILTARDRADRSILLGSHKIGRAARTLALLPAAAAADLAADRKDARVRVEMFYDEVADSLSREAAAALIASYAEKGVIVRRAASPGMHAKFLAWDDDHLLVTSQNLLSADPTDPFAELGLLIAFPGVAGDFRRRMEPVLS
jgi:phosphatidylserine/phosphatidylglycerophosphate/cardiolipin synthase-like enzyme